MAALSISILLSLSVFITYMLSCASKIQAKAEHSHYGYYMVRSGTIIGYVNASEGLYFIRKTERQEEGIEIHN